MMKLETALTRNAVYGQHQIAGRCAAQKENKFGIKELAVAGQCWGPPVLMIVASFIYCRVAGKGRRMGGTGLARGRERSLLQAGAECWVAVAVLWPLLCRGQGGKLRVVWQARSSSKQKQQQQQQQRNPTRKREGQVREKKSGRAPGLYENVYFYTRFLFSLFPFSLCLHLPLSCLFFPPPLKNNTIPSRASLCEKGGAG